MDSTGMISALRPHIRRASQIRLDAASPGPSHPGQSRIGGQADLGPAGDCPVCGTPLRFICQFNRDDFAHVDMPLAFFDFHYCFACMPWQGTGEGGVGAVLRGAGQAPDRAMPGATQVARAGEAGACLPVLDGAKTLMVSDDTIPFHARMTVDDPAYVQMWECYEQALDALEAWPFNGSFAGGYPVWIQGDDTPLCPVSGERMRLLVQIDAANLYALEDADRDWGEVGCVYLFSGSAGRYGFVLQGY